VVVLVYIPTNSGSFFPASSPTPGVGGVANDGYSNRGEVVLSKALKKTSEARF
jgi:hypothetical protein